MRERSASERHARVRTSPHAPRRAGLAMHPLTFAPTRIDHTHRPPPRPCTAPGASKYRLLLLMDCVARIADSPLSAWRARQVSTETTSSCRDKHCIVSRQSSGGPSGCSARQFVGFGVKAGDGRDFLFVLAHTVPDSLGRCCCSAGRRSACRSSRDELRHRGAQDGVRLHREVLPVPAARDQLCASCRQAHRARRLQRRAWLYAVLLCSC